MLIANDRNQRRPSVVGEDRNHGLRHLKHLIMTDQHRPSAATEDRNSESPIEEAGCVTTSVGPEVGENHDAEQIV